MRPGYFFKGEVLRPWLPSERVGIGDREGGRSVIEVVRTESLGLGT